MSQAEKLLTRLYNDPTAFRENGGPYALLQEHFAGLPLVRLKQLLKIDLPIDIIRAGIWIASELGREACCLVDEAMHLLPLKDRYISYHVLDVVMVCSSRSRHELFVNIVQMLESDDEIVARRSAWLAGRANKQQLQAALNGLKGNIDHKWGLEYLLNSEALSIGEIALKVNDNSRLVQRYAAAVLRRKEVSFQSLAETVAGPINEEVRAIVERG